MNLTESRTLPKQRENRLGEKKNKTETISGTHEA